ncbi:MAG: MarR family transcriptional regulator [Rickettsiales bacterium]|jgi:MarR family transcriptional regulator for hemolysin|nr:MarR family transcriptional regulator [Rickettsiales bacterium]
MSAQKPFHETLDFTLIGNMGRVHRLCREAVTLTVEPLGLTQSRWLALMHINLIGEGVTQLALAQSLGIEMPSLTRTLKQLEELSLISRQVDNNDKRSKKLYFTKEGHVVLNSLNEKIADVKQQFYAGLTHEQLDAMARALLQIEQNASACISQQEKRAKSNTEEDE